MSDPSEMENDAATMLCGTRRLTLEALRERALRAAAAFAAAGIGPDDAVALLMRNDLAVIEASMGAAFAGAFAVPINWEGSAEDKAFILSDCGAKLFVAHADLLDAEMRGVLPAGLPIVVVPTPPEVREAFALDVAETHSDDPVWDDWIGRHAAAATPARASRAPIIYTSGSTGRPKGVRRGTPRSDGSSKAMTVYGFDRPGPIRALANGPLHHSVPNAYARLALQAGVDIVLAPRFDPEETLALIARHAITHLHVVPAMMVRLLRLPEAVKARYSVASLRHVVHGAAPCPREVKAAMLDWWGPVLHEYYGSTETGLLTLATPDDWRVRPGTVGRALPGISLHILDGEGRPLPPGADGEVFAGSASLHDFTYVNQKEKRTAIGRGDLVSAGDIGRLDADGYLSLRGRGSELIRIDGRDIHPAEIEAALLGRPEVGDCAVISTGGGAGKASITVCVEPAGGEAELDDAALQRTAAAALAEPTIALSVEIVQRLPREDSGKVFKQILRQRFGGC